MDGGSVWLCRWICGYWVVDLWLCRWIGEQWMADPCGCVGG